ncbi:hypothetical protein NDA10_007701 [Ustilago hordei]|uniref:AB hydrolase-1 domain-containing protein n=1 Tax=Ustilago hordei TaxID=120017 RepID=I2G1P2_USTHO|nr:uncharacterized protein UHO2_02443 [Ustilago hordei]KAJ1040110.1 hypothetical protein NDA10_007701 [Ustilago hordei]CCF53085.1 uncharacterized protein UHOR_02881 [Ustilago hordei]SYW77635.1 uncharacterized protein UHO2_02443 [Ustilago hordei]
MPTDDFRPAELLPSLQPPHPHVRPAIPILAPRVVFTAPSQDPSSNGTQQWISTTHVYPAAWPRSHVRSAKSDIYDAKIPSTSRLGPLPSDPQAAKAEQRRRREADFEHWVGVCGGKEHEGQRKVMRSLRSGCLQSGHTQRITEARTANEAQLWMTVNRIVPAQLGSDAKPKTKDTRQGITLVMAHANGFHKEIFEPALEALVQKLQTEELRGKYRIDEIWNFDCTHSGQAGSINRDILGDTISWADHPRDMLKFLENYLPNLASDPNAPPSWLPTFLPSHKASSPTAKRRLIGLGHSFGGASMTFLLHARPRMLEGLILIDPAIIPCEDEERLQFDKLPNEVWPALTDFPLAKGAVARKDTFDSLPDAKVYFESKPFFKVWHPRVLDLHLRFGLRPSTLPPSRALAVDDVQENDLKRTPLELNNTKWHEAAAFVSTWMGYIGRKGMLATDHGAWVGVVNMKGGFDNKGLAADIDGLERGISFTIEGNHLVAQEEPDKLADALVKVLKVQSSPQAFKEEKLHRNVQKPRL